MTATRACWLRSGNSTRSSTASAPHWTRVVEITANTDEVVARLLNRAKEQGRADDTEEVIRRRMDVYAEQTEPLVRVYSEQGLLVKVDGMGGMDEVTERLLAALGA